MAFVAWRSKLQDCDRQHRDEVELIVQRLGIARLSSVHAAMRCRAPSITETEVYRHLLTLEHQGRVHAVMTATTYRGVRTEFQSWTPS